MRTTKRFFRQIWHGFRPPPRLTVSEWADRYRRLSAESSAEPGRWDTSRAEYQRGIMDAVCDPGVEQVVIMTSAQIGKTEVVGNTVGYFIDQDPSTILVVQPTLEMGQAWSKDRLAPMIRDTPALADKVADVKSKTSGNTMLHKLFPGGQITICGANSPASLASRPIRIVLCDEVDRYPGSAGAEGDPVNLAKKRSTTFWNRKIILTSTPTIKGQSRIEAAFLDSDQRFYFVPCAHCGNYQKMEWKSVKWPENKPENAVYHCSHCGAEWSESDRHQAIANGEWRATTVGKPRTAGFALNELYSPWVTPAQMAIGFTQSKNDRELLKTWINTSLGESWEERGHGVKEESILALKDDRPSGLVPGDADILLAGCDTQDDGFWYEIRAFKRGQTLDSWQIRSGFVDSLESLEQVLFVDQYKDSAGKTCPVQFGLIDAMGHRTAEVYAWCRLHPMIRPLKGEQRMAQPHSVTRIDTFPGTSKPIPGGVQLQRVNVTYFKDALASKLAINPADPGAWHYHNELTTEQARQMIAEYRDDKGQWICPSGRANHLWDCSVYLLAAADISGTKYEQAKPAPRPQIHKHQQQNPYTQGRQLFGR